jgi:hypothetical protein
MAEYMPGRTRDYLEVDVFADSWGLFRHLCVEAIPTGRWSIVDGVLHLELTYWVPRADKPTTEFVPEWRIRERLAAPIFGCAR